MTFLKKHKMKVFLLFNLLLTIGMNLGHPVTPSLLKDLDLGPHVFGISFAAMSLTNFFFALIWSNLANGLKKTRILMVSSIGYAFAQLLFAYSTTEWSIYLARFLAGVFAGGFQVGLMTYIINEAPQQDQAAYITISSVIISVGAALGFYIGGKLGDYSIYYAFNLQAGLHLIMGLLFFLVLGPLESIEESFDRGALKASNPFQVLADTKHFTLGASRYIFLSVLMSSMAVTLFDQSFNYYIKDIFNFPPSVNGNIKALVGIFALVLNMFLIRSLSKREKDPSYMVLILTIVSMAFLSLILGRIDQSQWFLRFSLAWFGLNTVMIPLQQNLIMSYKEDVKTGNQLSGLYNALLMLGKIIGALLSSLVYTYAAQASFSVSGFFLLLAFLAMLLHRVFVQV